MNDFANDRFSEKEKDTQEVAKKQIISRHDMILKHDDDILSSLSMPIPKRLQELRDNEYAFIQKHLQARLKVPINDLDDYRIITNDDEIMLIAVIKNLMYMCTISDEKDQGIFVDVIDNPYVKMKYMFRFSLFQKIGKSTFLSAVRFKYPGFGCLSMEDLNIIDTAKKTITPLPTKITEGTYFLNIHEKDVRKDQDKIIIHCNLTDNLSEYVSGFDSTHDMAESRTYYGPHYSDDCEIDIQKGTMRKINFQ